MNRKAELDGAVVFWTGLEESGGPIIAAFERQGAVVKRHPLLSCTLIENENPFQEAKPDTLLIFSSARAVDAVRNLPIPSAKIAAVGPATEKKLRDIGCNDIMVPAEQNAAGLADAVIRGTKTPGHALFLRGDNALPTIPERLRAAGFSVTEQIVYRTEPVSTAEVLRIVSEILASAHVLLFGSPAGVRALSAAVLPSTLNLQKPELVFAALGPTTAAALSAAGIEHPVVAESPSPEDMVRAVQAALLLRR